MYKVYVKIDEEEHLILNEITGNCLFSFEEQKKIVDKLSKQKSIIQEIRMEEVK